MKTSIAPCGCAFATVRVKRFAAGFALANNFLPNFGPWQRAVAGTKEPTIDNIFPIMQTIYRDHWARSFDWESDVRLRPTEGLAVVAMRRKAE